jgi:tetratricopeptide (TPR) repeat protein
MPKGKKPAGKQSALSRTASGFGMKQVDLTAELRRIDRLLLTGDTQQAYHLVRHLCQRYPHQLEPQQIWASIAMELDDITGYGQACAQLMQLQPKNANHFYGFAASLMNGSHAILTWQMFQRAIALDPNHSMAAQAQASIVVLEKVLDEIVAPIELPRDEAIAMMSIHEWAQIYLVWGEYDKCREFELTVLELQPDLMPALNNLSLVAFMQGDLPEAISQSEKVLTIEPENIHALSNLVRYHILSGDRDRAQTFADRLIASQVDAWNPWTKKFEGLSYIGDDAAIVKLWKKLKRQKKTDEVNTGMGLHLVAVALARQGETEPARKLWQQALAMEPGAMPLVQTNLHNLDKPVGERHQAWPFTVDAWMTETMRQDLTQGLALVLQAGQDGTIKSFCQQYFEQHPAAIHWVELMCDRGDPLSTQVALNLAKGAEQPQLWEILRRFALGQGGSDMLRNEAAIALVKAEQLDPDNVRMWLLGEWQEVFLINYEFHEDSPFDHSPKILKPLGKALALLKVGTTEAAITAEALLRQALAIKTAPDLLNNLAVAYQLQNREDEAIALCRQIVSDYPTYVPARVTIAGFHLNRDEIDAADALLKPILKRTRFHIQDLATFSEGYLRLLTQQKQLTGAEGWLQLWRQVTPDHPRIEFWQQHLSLLRLTERVGLLADGSPKRKRAKRLNG